jgi:predicted transposase/invertase (TIGR01784 family)
MIRRFFLDEMPEFADAPLGLSILHLLRQVESQAAAKARDLIARTKEEIDDPELQADLIELIETVILAKLPKLSREEVQVMLQLHDYRKSRVYLEAFEEGIEQGIEQGIEKERQRTLQKDLRSVAILVAKGMTASEIADILELDEAFVRQQMSNKPA